MFFADSYSNLIAYVEAGIPDCLRMCSGINRVDVYPFYDDEDEKWTFAYYDPSYTAKVAYSQGRTIEYRRKGNNEWHVSTGGVIDVECYEYRVKPEETWYVHQDIDGFYFKSNSDTINVEFKGTEEECDKWIKEHELKTRRMTNRELARWLAEGKGERADISTEHVAVNYVYTKGEEDKECDEDIRIREWGSNEWHEPLVEV